MKIKIKKQGKQKEFKLISKWEDVTLEKWIKLIDFKKGTKTEEAKETIALLSNIPKDIITQLELKDVVLIMGKLVEFQEKQNHSLKRIIKIDDEEFGFHPDLEAITLGEYADLEQFIKLGIEDYLPEIMAILYRPIVEKEGNLYTIKAYEGNIKLRAEKMKKMSAEQVQSALVFFYLLGNVSITTTESFLTERLKGTKKQ
ncbi:MAG: hypothetical protein CML03_08575 [Pseudooceanicola sp.]|nr:hypothetical protein [Pseudooceanicola sp.]